MPLAHPIRADRPAPPPSGPAHGGSGRRCPRALLWVLCLGATLACGSESDGPGGSDSGPRPARNLVLISLDTLRADRLGCYGNPRPTSPNIDAFAAESLLFTDVTSAASNTAPSHMSMFTGLRPPVHGVFNVGGERPGRKSMPATLAPSMTTLAEHLEAAGFDTTAFSDGGFITKEMSFARGFGRFERRPQRVADKVDAALAYLAAADRSKRQFVFFHTYEIHAPYLPPLEHDLFTDQGYRGAQRQKVDDLRALEARGRPIVPGLAAAFLPKLEELDEPLTRYLMDLYDGGIHYTDAEIGRLLSVLTSPPWSDDTAVILLSDHGEAFGEHGSLAHAEVHRNVTHVPLIIHQPGGASGRRTEPVSGVDVLPTALQLVGLPAPSVCDGVSVLQPLRADRPVAAYNEDPFNGGGLSLRVGSHEIVRTWSVVPWRLYDLSTDPGQTRELPLDGREGQALVSRAERMLAEQQQAAELLGRGRGDAAELSPETLQQLEALGYLGDG